MHRKLLIITTVSYLILALLIQPGAYASNDFSSSIQKLQAEIKTAAERSDDMSEQQKVARVMRIYKQAGISSQLARHAWNLSPDDARSLFEAVNTASFYTDDPDIAHDQVKLARKLERMQLIRASDIVKTYGALIAARDFDAAQSFFDQHANALPHRPPRFIPLHRQKKNGTPELTVNLDGTLLKEVSTQLRSPIILVVGDPLCSYTQRAADDIARNSELDKVMQNYSKWIAPPSRQTDFSPYSKWNALHPHAHFSLVYRRSDRKMLDYWETPKFYFIKNGEIVRQVTGWPRGGHQHELIAAAKAIGLPIGSKNDLSTSSESTSH